MVGIVPGGFIKKPEDRGAVVDKLLKGIWRVF